VSSYDELELRAAQQHPAHQSSMYTLSRTDTSVAVTYDPAASLGKQSLGGRKKSFVSARHAGGNDSGSGGGEGKVLASAYVSSAEPKEFS